MNRFYRVVWNASKGVWQAVTELGKGQGKTKGMRALRRAAAVTLGLASLSVMAADVLPTGGNVVAGNAAISQSGSAMTINQTTNKAVIDWQSFSVGQNNSVTFIQPTATSVALNRVLGTDVSLIQGRISANGIVAIENPNGILFTQTAQVNVGGLIASTLKFSLPDFMNGEYKLAGASSNAIVNQGNITVANGGTAAFVAAKISNTGNVTANGGNVLMGAGSVVTLDLGGPVKLEVKQAAIDALIENGGAIKADGGLVYLRAHAAGELATTVINNTGVIEAHTLATGEKGQIYLIGDMQNDRIAVGGKLDASAPVGGDGGFIETSAADVAVADNAHVTAASAQGKGGAWLIDPSNITIQAGSCTGTNCLSAGTIETTLNGGTDVAIATVAAGSEAGDINVNAPISWNKNKLSLIAHNNININGTLTATGTGSLAFAYGQATADGAGSSYNVNNGAKIYIPSGGAFRWLKGSEGTVKNLVLDNGLLRFGNGTQTSLDSLGQLEQPFYFDDVSIVNGQQRNGWYKLTFSNYPLDLQLATGGDGTSSWNVNGQIANTQDGFPQGTTSSLEISGYKEGVGSIASNLRIAFADGEVLNVANTYTLNAGQSFLKTDTTVTNVGTIAASNVRLWVGTRDDFVAGTDQPFKYKGNLTSNGFEQLTSQNEQSKALKITELNDGQGAAILFYSTSPGADTSVNYCCSFENATGTDPRSSPITEPARDGSYALFMRLANLGVGQSDGMTWYYAAGPAARLDSIVGQVSASAGTPPAPIVVVPNTTTPVITAIASAQNTVNTNTATPATVNSNILPPPFVAPEIAGKTMNVDTSGGLRLVSLDTGTSGTPGNGNSNANGGSGAADGASVPNAGGTNQAGLDPSGFMKVFVVGGGVSLPDVAMNNQGVQIEDLNKAQKGAPR
ncbi:filamentous hemagglutinin N-terminal domain-containing protein [Herminiimonas glaciei]|uniref:Filamentous hemagglutinin N-terminal domain-containing protein n=1 Tax=Herminiimonas glaciei TaxID=523788 RepID=A0ABW2IC87_9BURK